MSRRNRLDAVVVGGGVVGAACALALARQDLRVALVEGREPAPWSAATPEALCRDRRQRVRRCLAARRKKTRRATLCVGSLLTALID